jgi:hypothetical protein
MKAHFKRNNRLSWAFKICKDLGIDDPVFWLNNVDPSLVDSWIAYSQYEGELESGVKEDTPENALEKLRNL